MARCASSTRTLQSRQLAQLRLKTVYVPAHLRYGTAIQTFQSEDSTVYIAIVGIIIDSIINNPVFTESSSLTMILLY